MASDIDREAKFNIASYKQNKEKKLKKGKKEGKFFVFLLAFKNKEGIIFVFW
jgi:hypothetical protein